MFYCKFGDLQITEFWVVVFFAFYTSSQLFGNWNCKSMCIIMEIVPPLQLTQLPLFLGRLSTSFWSLSAAICARLIAFLRSDVDVGWEGLAGNLLSSLSQRYGGVEVRALCGTVKLFHTKIIHPFFGLSFVQWGSVPLEQKSLCKSWRDRTIKKCHSELKH